YGAAYRTFILWGSLAGLTLGLLFPKLIYEQYRFKVSNRYIGTTRFQFDARLSKFYRTLVLAGIVIAVIFASTSWAARQLAGAVPSSSPTVGMLFGWAPFIVLLVLWPAITGFVEAHLTNETLNHTTIGPHRLVATLSDSRLAWINMSNLVA